MIELQPNPPRELIERVYADDYSSRSRYDGYTPIPIVHELVTYIAAFVHGKFMGCFIAIRQSDNEIELHSMLLKHARMHSRRLGSNVIAWVFAQSDKITRITSEIIDKFTTVVNFCRKLGYQIEGVRRDACFVGGELRGVVIMGITRKDFLDG